LYVSTGIAPPMMRPGPAPSGTPFTQSLYAHSRWLVLWPCGSLQSGLGRALTERKVSRPSVGLGSCRRSMTNCADALATHIGGEEAYCDGVSCVWKLTGSVQSIWPWPSPSVSATRTE
jgi:hypothetical protein